MYLSCWYSEISDIVFESLNLSVLTRERYFVTLFLDLRNIILKFISNSFFVTVKFCTVDYININLHQLRKSTRL
jgi:hypothetical protein